MEKKWTVACLIQGKEIWIVKLRDVNSLNDSELLKGQMLLVRSSDRLELEDEDDFLVQVRAIPSCLTLAMHVSQCYNC